MTQERPNANKLVHLARQSHATLYVNISVIPARVWRESSAVVLAFAKKIHGFPPKIAAGMTVFEMLATEGLL